MSSKILPAPREVWTTIYPFEEIHNYKTRPGIVLDVSDDSVIFATMMISSLVKKDKKTGQWKLKRTEFPFVRENEVEISDLAQAGLDRKSVAKVTRIEELGIELFVKKIGVLSNYDWKKILQKRRNLENNHSIKESYEDFFGDGKLYSFDEIIEESIKENLSDTKLILESLKNRWIINC